MTSVGLRNLKRLNLLAEEYARPVEFPRFAPVLERAGHESAYSRARTMFCWLDGAIRDSRQSGRHVLPSTECAIALETGASLTR